MGSSGYLCPIQSVSCYRNSNVVIDAFLTFSIHYVLFELKYILRYTTKTIPIYIIRYFNIQIVALLLVNKADGEKS